MFAFFTEIASVKIKSENTATSLPGTTYKYEINSHTQKQRLQHMDHVCKHSFRIQPLNLESDPLKYSLSSLKQRLETTFVNDDYKLLVTIVYKTGSEGWKKVFKQLFERGENILQQKLGTADGIYKLSQLYKRVNGTEEVLYRLRNYYSVIFVRHPYTRMLSAYRSKFLLMPNDWYVKKTRDIISRVRKARLPIDQKPDLKFDELVQYITLGGYDEHWCPIFKEKKPCHIFYDFIGHLETFQFDIEYLFHLLGIEDIVDYPPCGHATGSSDVEILKKYFSSISLEALQKLNRQYRDDFKAFGYRLPQNVSDFDDLLL